MTWTPELIVQLVTVLVGLLGAGGVVGVLMQKSKINAEAKKLNVEAGDLLAKASISMLDPMEKRVNFFSGQLLEAQRQTEQLQLTLSTTRLEMEELNRKLRRYNDLYGPLPAE